MLCDDVPVLRAQCREQTKDRGIARSRHLTAEQRADSRQQRAESREQRAESREQRAESREQRAESRESRKYTYPNLTPF
jgi:hypothetical protein